MEIASSQRVNEKDFKQNLKSLMRQNERKFAAIQIFSHFDNKYFPLILLYVYYIVSMTMIQRPNSINFLTSNIKFYFL